MVEIKRGEIVITNLGHGKGSEQAGIRPALVIQNDLGNKFSSTTIIAPITSKRADREFPTNVRISKKDSGLEKDSVILLNQITAIDKSRITKKVSILDNENMKKVDLAIKISLGLD